ncbi:MAG: hypothetical protein M3P26_11620 [Gemmatimonadota bacterium]|nr:hypothetical protein [Gemmatimonadota bacterium]
MSVKHLYLIAVAAILGCAPASSTSGRSGTIQVPRAANYLTGEEIVAANADVLTLYDAIARLRSNWLAPHGVAAQGSEFAVVYVDGQPYGDINSLRSMHAYQVADIRYYDITQAGARFGIRGGTGGVIEVRTKTR